MAINTTNLETVLSSKIASATTATLDKDLLLISKSVEALDNSIGLKAVDIGVTVQGYNSDLATNASVATAVTDMATNASVATAVAGIVSELVDSSPSTLNTIQEISTALGDDANHVTTMTTLIGNKINAANPTFTGTLDGAGNSYTNLHPAVTTASVTSAHALDLTLPFHAVTLTGTTLFSTSALAVGRMIVVSMGVPSSVVPSFGAEVKWAGAEEPTWADSTHWVISMTCISSTVIVASATGFTV